MSSAYPWEVHLDRSVCLSGTLTRGAVMIGGHGLGFSATRPNAFELDIARSVVLSTQITSVTEGIREAIIQGFNNASNGPIDLCYSLRWPDSGNSNYDNPPTDLTASSYTTVRDQIVSALGGTEAQILINRDGLTLGMFNEIRGGPGRFHDVTSGLPSEAKQAAGLALATSLVAYIRANVANANKIIFTGPGFTNVNVVHPDYVASSTTEESRQRWYREWIDWCAENDALIDIHLQPEDLDELEEDIEAVRAYCEEQGYTFNWCSTECGPANYPQGNITAGQAFDRDLWSAMMAHNPVFLCRAPFFENAGSGSGYVYYSILDSDAVTPKWPWANILADQVALPASSEFSTSFTLPFTDSTIDCAVASNDFGDLAGSTPEVLSNSGTVVIVAGDWTGGCMKLGRLYTFRVQLSQVFRRRRDGSADADAWYTIRRIITRFRDSGPYTLRVTMPNRTARSVTFTQDDDVTEAIGTFKAWMQGNSEDIGIYIESTSPKPVTVTSVEIIADYDSKNETM